MFAKVYNGFSILYCTFFTLIGLLLIILPLNGYWIAPPYDGQKWVLSQTMLVILGLLTLTPPIIALTGYYLSGGIGKKWFSHLFFVPNILSLVIIGLAILFAIFTYFTSVKNAEIGDSTQTEYLMMPLLIAAVFNIFILPVVYTVLALIVQKFSIWKRLLPILSLISSFVITFVLALILFVIGSVTKSVTLYNGMQEATILQWLMLGSIAWGLINLIAFFNGQNTEENISIPPPPPPN